MAHVGRFYKLQFRRDLASVRNNNQAYPEAILWDQSNLSGVLGLDVRNNQPILINLEKESQPPMIWTSDVRTAGGIDYRVRLTIINPFETATASLVFRVFDEHTAVDYFRWSQSLKNSSSNFGGWSGSLAAPFVDSPQYRIVGGTFFWDWGAAPWDRYNP